MIELLRICAGVIFVTTLVSGCGSETDFSEFDAVTVKRTGSFELNMSPDDAFPLFTAPGERLWAPGWDPAILSGDGYEEGTVWVTTGHGHTGYWYVSDYDPVNRHAQYVRVTPGADSGTVDVWVASNADGGSTVNVTYQLTGLSSAGNAHLETSFSKSQYAEMMNKWRNLINDNQEKINDHFGR